MPSRPRHCAAMPPSDRPDDLAQAEEHRVQAHDRAAVVRVRLGHVGEQPDGRRRGARRARTARRSRRRRAGAARQRHRAAEVVDPEGRREQHGAAQDPVEDDRGPAHRREPAAPPEDAGEEQQPADRQPDRSSPPGSSRPSAAGRELRVGLADELEQRRLVNRPSVALMAIQVGASSHTWLTRRGSSHVARASALPRTPWSRAAAAARRAPGRRACRSRTRRGRASALSRNAIGPRPGTAARQRRTRPSARRASPPRTGRPPGRAAPRRAAVAKAMNPRIEGTEAAVEAPSSSRVQPRTGRFVVNAVMITAIAAERRPERASPAGGPSRSDSTPKSGEPMSSRRRTGRR